jgi:hypothetical protein
MKRGILIIATLHLTMATAQACNEGKSFDLAKQPLPEKPNTSFDVAEQQSAEGGSWEIYNGTDGRPQRIVRTDYGEMGRAEHRLAITAPGDYLIMNTRWQYSAPIYAVGTTIREEIDYIEFCGGKLDMPTEAEWAENTEYEKLARESADVFFNAPEVAQYLKAAGVTPPLWK